MAKSRRDFIKLVAGGMAVGTLLPTAAVGARLADIRAVAFDGFAIFDPRPVFALAEKLFPGRGNELGSAWRARQFDYQWLRALSGQYADFNQVTEESLAFAAKMLKLELTAEKSVRLMDAYHELKAWPDVLPALKELRESGIRLALLSNMTKDMLEANINSASLGGIFEHVLSTDRIKTYKPNPHAYQMSIEAFHLNREEILFVPFAGWDAAGAKWFGYRTFWVNRLNLPAEKLGNNADAVAVDLTELPRFIKQTL